jgi:outer membrane protein TolC
MRNILFILTCGIYCLSVISTLHATPERPAVRSVTFSQAAQLAIEASAELRHARSSRSLMEGVWRWGLRAYFPRVSISVSENDRLQQIGSDSFIKNYSLNIDQLLWDGGRTSMTRNLERTELELTSSRLVRMAAELAESAIAAYRNILSSRAILEIRNSTLAILEEQCRIINEEVQLGLTLRTDLLNAELNLADSRIEISLIQLELTEMERQFYELLGLESMPILTERVDTGRSSALQIALAASESNISSAAATLAREQNPDLIEARHSITKRQAELSYVSNLWIPSLRLTANAGIGGQNYPLTRFNWSVGLNIDFSSPWFQNRFNVQAGFEPVSLGHNFFEQSDRTAMVQNSFTPLPDPAAGFGRRQAALALAFERERYNTFLERTGRLAAIAVERIIFADQRRLLALEAAALGEERRRIEETRLNLGQITRIRLMETLIEQTQREIAVIQAATALLEAERDLERFLDIEPGELTGFAQVFSATFQSAAPGRQE